MSHTNRVIDADPHFEIDAVTRNIRNVSQSKTTLVQYDHNSERFSFALPRFIEGHDMKECNSVQVHYINIDTTTKAESKGVYSVNDLAVCEEDTEKVCCTWLISQNVTKSAGALQFLLRFSCISENGLVDYAWHTNPFTGISVSAGINNAEEIVEQYADILEQWKQELSGNTGNTGNATEQITNLKDLENAISSGKKYIVLSNTADITLAERLTLPQGTTLIGNGATLRRGEGHRDRILSLLGNCTVSDLIIEGGSVSDGTWDTVIDIVANGNDTISNVTINNGNECIIVYGENNLVENCKITKAEGNGIHLSGCTKSTIRGNIIKNTNLSTAYENGRCCIYVCLSVFDCVIDGNYCENGYNGIGNLNTPENQRIKITNNTVVDCDNYGISAQYYSNEAEYSPKDCIISHNIVKNSRYVYIGTTHSEIQLSELNFIFSNNTLLGTDLYVKGCKNITIANNILKDCGIELFRCEKLNIIDNKIEHLNAMGISGGDSTSECIVSGNNITAFNNAVVFSSNGGNKNHITNNIINGYGDNTNFYGITVGSGAIIKGNRINTGAGTGITGSSNSLITDNIISGANSGANSEVIAIRVWGGNSNMIIANNMCNGNARFEIAEPTNGVVENNIVCEGLI